MKLPVIALSVCVTLGTHSNSARAEELQYLGSSFWAGAQGVAVVDSFAFCAFLNGLLILDISDPQHPLEAGRVYCPGDGYAVDVAGNYAFLADERAGLQIIDVSDVHHPAVVACYDTPGRAEWVRVRDGLAYVADGPGSNSGLIILDVSTPWAPQYLGNYCSGGMCSSFYLDGNHAYIGGIFEGLEIVDVSDPGHPALTAFYSMCSSHKAFVTGGIAYVTAACGGSDARPDEYSILTILDVADPAHPLLLGEHIFEMDRANGPIVVAGDCCYVGCRDDAGSTYVAALDISDPVQPALVGTAQTDGFPADLILAGQTILAALGSGGVQVLTIDDPATPVVLGSWREGSGPASIAGRDGLGYLSDGGAGLRVLDITDPLAPTSLAQLPLPGAHREVALSGDLAYMVDFGDALSLIDVSDPSHPELLARIEDDVRAASLRGDYAYIAAGEEGLRIYDVSDPAQPGFVGQCTVPGYAWDVEVAGDYAYLCAFHEGIQIVDISDPQNPGLRGGVGVHPDYLMAMALVGSYVYAPTTFGHLMVFDVSDPDAPTLALTYPLNCLTTHVGAYGDRLYVSTFDQSFASGLTVLDITERLAPVVVTSYMHPGSSQDVFNVDGSRLLVATGASLLVLGPEGAALADPFPVADTWRLWLTAPNPAVGPAGIGFALPVAAVTRVDLLDASGRLRATLFHGPVAAGRHHLSWDWKAAGLAAGTYFIRLSGAGRQAVQTITLVR
jgi:hypothetical protein